MKSFLKFTLASTLGVILAIFIFIIIAVASSGEKEVKIASNSVLKINLNEISAERSNKDPFANFNILNTDLEEYPGLWEVIKAIDIAKNDNKVKGIYLNGNTLLMGYAAARELHYALKDFKESGKFIYAYSEVMDQKFYYIASCADKIWLNPQGNLSMLGLAANITFYTEALAQVGVEMQIIRHGKFKSAVEPFLLTEMSEANEEQTSQFISSIWNNVLADIASARNVSTEQLNLLINNGSLMDADIAKESGLIDDTFYRDQVLAELKSALGLSEEQKVKYHDALYLVEANPGKYSKDKIAIVFAHGNVVDGNAGEGTVSSGRISKAIKKAREDDGVKAIVLRINSPGGSALASEVIWREIMLTKGVKPIYASMGDVAASGGYYIACLTDKIYAQPTTITGSIGVFGMFPNAQKLMEDKIKLHFDGVKTNALADFGSINRPLQENEKQLLQSFVEKTYDVFTKRVAEGRDLSQASVDSIGQGRVWSGHDAQRINLVDDFAGLQQVVELAAQEQGLEEYRILEYPELKDPIQQILEDLSKQAKIAIWGESEIETEYKRLYEELQTILDQSGIQMWMPYQFNW